MSIYTKTITVIDSCITLEQVLVARNYLHLANKYLDDKAQWVLSHHLNFIKDEIYHSK